MHNLILIHSGCQPNVEYSNSQPALHENRCFQMRSHVNVPNRFIINTLIVQTAHHPKYIMRDLIDSSSEQHLVSPTAFIVGLEQPNHHHHFQFQNQGQISSDASYFHKRIASLDDRTKGSEKVEKKRLAGFKSREKKRRQLQQLEQSVKHLATQIQKYDSQISKCKSQLVQAIKTSTNNSSEHSFTFSELQKAITDDPDYDRINLLLDLIQDRIGANGKERQSKIQYNFKQIINSLFPAGHRYLMHSAVYHQDLFQDHITSSMLKSQNENKWTKNLFESVNFTQQQIDLISSKKTLFINKRRQTIDLIFKLKQSKLQLKQQQQIFQKMLNHIREDMTPIQSAQITLFGEKNKLRQQFNLFCEQFSDPKPQKKIKTQ